MPTANQSEPSDSSTSAPHSTLMFASGLRRLDGLRGRCPGETSTYIKPEAVEDFVSKAGFGFLGISIGTSRDA